MAETAGDRGANCRQKMQPQSKPPPPEPVPYVPGRTTAWNTRWHDLFDHFGQAILAYAKRCGLNEQSAEDVLQEVMTTLIRCQHGQEPGWDASSGSFQAWLWGVIRNRVRSVRRHDTKELAAAPAGPPDSEFRAAGPVLPEIVQPPADFEGLDEQRWQQALLAAALRKIQARVTAENFAIYTALLEERADPEQLARTYGREPNALYAVKHRCEKMLAAEARQLRAAWEQLS
jgi:DNA-directed RNA polymerase specialized sigma24 family protein